MLGNYRFIDLFAGIGGGRTGFERAGFECVFVNVKRERIFRK